MSLKNPRDAESISSDSSDPDQYVISRKYDSDTVSDTVIDEKMGSQKPRDADWLSDHTDSDYDADLCRDCDGYVDSEIRLKCVCVMKHYEQEIYVQVQKDMKKEFQHGIQLNSVKKEMETHKQEMEKYKQELEGCKRTLMERNDEIQRLKTAQEENEKLIENICQMCNDAVFMRYRTAVPDTAQWVKN